MKTMSETTGKNHVRSKQGTALEQLQSLFSPKRAQKRLEATKLMFRKFNPKANPKMIGMEFTTLVNERDDFVDLITQGNQDGSMHGDHIEQTAEIFRLLANIWQLPFFRRGTQASCASEPLAFSQSCRAWASPCKIRGSPTCWPPLAPMPKVAASPKAKSGYEPARSRLSLKQRAADTTVHCSSDD